MKTKADYRSIEKRLENIIENRSKGILKADQEIREEKEKLKKAIDKKNLILETGTKEDYLEACSREKKIEDSIEFLEAKKKSILMKNKVGIEDLKSFINDVNKEQHRITKSGLKEFIEKVDELRNLYNDITEDQNRGDALLNRVVLLFKEDTSEGEIKALSSSTPYLLNPKFTCNYGYNYVFHLEKNLKGFEWTLNSPGIKEYLEGK